MQKIMVVEYRDHFYQIPQVISDRNTPFNDKKKLEGGVLHYIKFVTFFIILFLQQPPPLWKYFNFAAN